MLVDIHNHLIFGVDDGPADLSGSLALAMQAAAEGITHIVCTPHASEQFPYRKEAVEARFDDLRSKLAGKIDLSLGCEMHMTADNVFDAVGHPLRYSFNNRGYLLIEFATQSIPSNMLNAISSLMACGYTPIIAHPERYPGVTTRPEMLARWMRQGCLLQVTAGSLYGRFGRTAEAFSNELLSRNWIHFVATDAHDVKWRPAHLKKCYEYISNRVGSETARRVCITNPQAAVQGTIWPEQPVPEGLINDAPLKFSTEKSAFHGSGEGGKAHNSDVSKAHHKSLWNRLFREVRT